MGETVTFVHYLRVLRRGWWIVLLSALVATGTALGLSLRQERLYEASAQVLLTNNQSLAASLSNLTLPSSDPGRVAETQAKLARVPTVARRTLDAAGLENRSADRFLAESSVSASSNADLLTFSVTDPSRVLAAQLATSYARQYTRYRLELDTASLTRARRQLAGQLTLLEGQGRRDSTLYDSLLEKDQQLATMQALQTSNAAVVRSAEGASQVQPQTVRNALLGFVLGTLLGIGLAFLREALDTRVRSTDELQQRLGLPLLARLPEPPRGLRRADRLVMLEGPQSHEAEPYRILAANLDFANLERGARSIMITSALEGEGKSTTVANLAVAVARTGRRVIVADLDLRNPSLHRFFGLHGRHGITQVAAGAVPVDEALARVPLLDQAHEGLGYHGNGSLHGLLEVIPCGPVPPNPGEFAQSGALRKILAELGQRADLVLVDAPPLLGVGDAVVLSGQIDVLLVVARLSRLRTTTLNELHRVLLTSPAPAIGLVATDAEVEHTYAYSGYAPPLADVERERAST